MTTAFRREASPTDVSTKNSTAIDHDFLMSGWFENHPHRPKTSTSLPKTDDLKSFLGMTWPMSASYSNLLNAIWLMQVLDLRLLRSRPHWFIRDGLVPLLWFFRRFPNPPAFETTLLIDEDLVHFVPPSWRHHVGTYRIHSEVEMQPQSRTAVVGLAAQTNASIAFTKHRLQEIVNHEKEDGIETMDLFMPAKSWAHDEKDQVFHASIFREIFAIVPKQTRVMSREELAGTFDVQKLRLYDLNEKLIVADNGLVGELLKKGAQWPGSRPAQAHEKYHKISPSHGFVINWRRPTGVQDFASASLKQASRFHDQVGNVFCGQAFQSFPWPKWFSEWAQAQVESELFDSGADERKTETPLKNQAEPVSSQLKRSKKKNPSRR